MRQIKSDGELEQLKKNNDYLLQESLANAKIWLIKVVGVLLVLLVVMLILSAFLLIGRHIYFIWNDAQEIKNIIINCVSALFGATMTIIMSRKK
jgi:hypothetical protein